MKSFREIFGDEKSNYQEALDLYYSSKPHLEWNQQYISEYAMAHPLEDWEECWAHYLHMVDTLETARHYNVLEIHDSDELDTQLFYWSNLSVALNELNRSMGLSDAYPFILNLSVIRKLGFVNQVIDPNFTITPVKESP